MLVRLDLPQGKLRTIEMDDQDRDPIQADE
jgi:hypothetical protein